MDNYKAPIEDILFTLTELTISSEGVDLPEQLKISKTTLLAILEAGGKLFGEVLSPLNQVGDTVGTKLSAMGVITPPGFKEAYGKLVEAGWISLSFPEEEGGQGLPSVVDLAITEMMQSANAAFTMCPGLAGGAATIIRAKCNTKLKKRYLPKIASGEWSTAMCLTEVQAGSDLSDIRTKAIPLDEHYLITGTKIFISWADHDMTENIVHLVLARTPNAPPKTRGLSLFLVPKFIPQADGSLGEQNDFFISSIEEKLGLHGSPTCTVNYGDNKGAVGYLVGQENEGLDAMFAMMNHTRIQVGLQGASLTERAYQQSLHYAKQRIQGDSPTQNGQVPIIRHADVRRLLLSMKSGIEAIRTLAYVTAMDRDMSFAAESKEQRDQSSERVALLIPIVKGWSTEFAQELIQHGIQIHGGAGYIEETGISQYMRDLRITTIYEGTSAMQALDLVNRKLIKDKGLGFERLLADMRVAVKSLQQCNKLLSDIGTQLSQSIDTLDATVDWILCNHKHTSFIVGAIAYDFLMQTGYVIGAWQLARGALAANRQLQTNKETNMFYRQKIELSRFYSLHILPRAQSHSQIVRKSGTSVDVSIFN